MQKRISSVQNPLIKELVQLKEKARARKKAKQFIIEGIREISLAIKGNHVIEKVLFNEDIVSSEYIQDEFGKLNIDCIEITAEVYAKISYRSSTEGLIAIAQFKDFNLNNLNFSSKTPLILIAEAPEKPGNIGALLRTADAANIDAVLIANPKTDLYNPNIIRSSVGCVFTNQIAMGTTQEILDFLNQNKISTYCAALLNSSEPYYKQDYTSATAIVVGTEATGLSHKWLDNSKKNIIIPMQGAIDSMNVSVSAGILIFEAKRQRNFL